MDWSDKAQVIAYAKKMGKGMTVYQHPGRPNLNITHTIRKDRYKPDQVIYQT